MLKMSTLPQLLSWRAGQEPGRLAQRHKQRGIWRQYSFAQVLDEVRAFALGLEALGLARGDTVAVLGENEPEHFWTEYAAQALGCRVVSLYPDLTVDEIEYLLNDSAAVTLVAQDQEQVDKGLAILGAVPSLRHIVYWDDTGMWSYRQPVLRTFASVQATGRQRHAQAPGHYQAQVDAGQLDDVAVLSYTSGTTGRPKGVMLSHRYLVDNAHRLVDACGARPGMEYLTYIAPAWATEQFFGLTMGLALPLVVNFPEGPEQVQANIRELAVEVAMFAPRQWESLAASMEIRTADGGRLRRVLYHWGVRIGHAVNVARLEGRKPRLLARLAYPLANALVLRPLRDQLGLTRARVALCGGSMMSPDVFRLFHAIGVPLRNSYGSTETGILTTHRGAAYNLETAGHWVQAHPAAESALEWKVSGQGELLVRGGTFALGYHGKQEKFAEKIEEGWYRTGDAVTVTQQGELVFLDRMADMRRLRSGESFPPQFVETRLRFSPFIKDVMTVGDERRDFVTALVNIDMGVVSRWAEEHKIGFSTYTDLSQKPEVAARLREEIARVNRFLPAHAQVRRFACFPKELDPDEGELTRTRKLRREFLEQRYAGLIDSLYHRGSRQCDVSVPVTYQDGRRGELRACVALHDMQPVQVSETTEAGGVPQARAA